MKVLLIRPKPDKRSLGLMNLMTCEPLELEYVATVVKNKGHQVELIDLILERHNLAFFVKKHQPDVVCFTAYITHVGVVKNYSRLVKEIGPNIITVVGGVHSEVLPNDFKCPTMDYILGINGLENISLLLDALAKGKKPIFKHKTINKRFAPPLPDRQITAKYRHRYDYAFHSPCALIKTSYGCPYNCQFCFCIAITKNSYWERELQPVIDELKTIQEPNVFIVDDNFLCNRERVITFCQLLKKNKIKKKFIVFGRADFISANEKVVAQFKKHGLSAVFVGIETFKQTELNNFNKRLDVKVSEQAAAVLHQHDIDFFAGGIIGPDWDKKDFHDFTDWLRKIKIKFVNLQPLIPLPGTPIYKKYQGRILFKRDEYEKWDLTHVAIRPTKLTISQYYLEIVKGYLRSTGSLTTTKRIYQNYGLKMTIKCGIGAIYILWHYIVMAIQAKFIKAK